MGYTTAMHLVHKPRGERALKRSRQGKGRLEESSRCQLLDGPRSWNLVSKTASPFEEVSEFRGANDE